MSNKCGSCACGLGLRRKSWSSSRDLTQLNDSYTGNSTIDLRGSRAGLNRSHSTSIASVDTFGYQRISSLRLSSLELDMKLDGIDIPAEPAKPDRSKSCSLASVIAASEKSRSEDERKISSNQSQVCVARARYDNVAETSDELAFRCGDILTVIEKDVNGLEGWWLCSLRGRKGIAPGNRLQILPISDVTKMEGTTQVQVKQTESNQNCKSWDQRNSKVVTPQRVGNVYVYQPTSDYDVPPSRYRTSEGSAALRDSQGNFRSQSPLSGRGLSPEPSANLYETPPRSHIKVPQAHVDVRTHPGYHGEVMYETPLSNRSSNVSMLSTGSTATVSSSTSSHSLTQGSAPSSACGSARSSTELAPQELYDVPPAAKGLGKIVTPQRLSNASSRYSDASSCDAYDTPTLTRSSVRSQKLEGPEVEAYSSTNLAKPSLPSKEFDPSAGQIYDTPPKLSDQRNTKTLSQSSENWDKEGLYDNPLEHAIDDLYDVPAKKPVGKQLGHAEGRIQGLITPGVVDPNSVYDIPPQVTRDSTISILSDSIDESSNRLSSCSNDSRGSDILIPYDELPLELDAALEMLVKLQQDVTSAATRLLGFVSSSWRQMENLEPRLYDIKLAIMKVRTTLQEMVDFGQGALANSAKAEDKKLIRKLIRHLEPLQVSLLNITEGMRQLDALRWQATCLAINTSAGQVEEDYLGQIGDVVKDVPTNVRSLASLIQGNSKLLFHRSQDSNKSGCESAGKVKPPIKPKPKWSPDGEKRRSVQERPLPSPPKEQPLPNFNTPQSNLKSVRRSSSRSSDGSNYDPVVYDLPEMAIRGKGKDDNDYENDSGDWLHDYDYVALDKIEPSKEGSVSPSGADSQASVSGISSEKPGEPQIASEYSIGTVGTAQDDSRPVRVEIERSDSPQTGLSAKFKERLALLQKDSEQPVNTDMTNFVASSVPSRNSSGSLADSDKQLLLFYKDQIDTHSTVLVNAIDAFFQCVEYNQPPKIFIAHSKFVILAAHKLVYIGDTLQRNLVNEEVRTQVMSCANYLCDCLKLTVTSTKNAALQYPSIPAMQEMVDRVVDVSHAANQLKQIIIQSTGS